MLLDTPLSEIDAILQQAWIAFHSYRKLSLQQRADFMRTIAEKMENAGDALIQTAMQETNLPEARLRNERARTMFQLTSYADACEKGDWLEARIDTAIPAKNPPKPDLRKMLVPLGPVVVFGASNFPFAYSTAGGDTACAFAAGCPVIVKAHPAHAETSEIVAQAILKAVERCNMPKGIFAHVHGAGTDTGKALVMHPRTKAVGFTGSYAGGKQLFDWGNQRKEPIPVFAEMGSINPIYLLPGKLSEDPAAIARSCAASITLGVGQFCTNPGLIIGVESPALQQFTDTLQTEITPVAAAKMLHPGIAKAYAEKKQTALQQPHVNTIIDNNNNADGISAAPAIASVTGSEFLTNPVLHQEVFGPYSLIVRCSDMQQVKDIAEHIEGQLTSTLMATDEDVLQHKELVEAIQNTCGRVIMNGVPTGVEVCLSMQHGGPFPATTDARFTSVGADGIKRFARPVAFQNWSNDLLPDELKNGNPLQIWRTVNNELSKSAI
jgi:NADP-dependent aldehyde dehydrogenase